MKILVACEESQTVCKAFRERGHEAYSVDIQEPTGGHPEWHKDRKEAINFFFMNFANADCEKIVIENPVGIMSSAWRKPDQIIQPWQFGDAFEKKTCLWLKGLPRLQPTNIVDIPPRKVFDSGKSMPKEERAKLRSKTFPGIAEAMAG